MEEVSKIIFGPPTPTIFLGIITIFFLYWYSIRKHAYWKQKGLPYVPPYPFVGTSLPGMFKPLQDIDLQRQLKYGEVYGHFEGNSPCLSVADPELLRDILVKDFQFFSSRTDFSITDKTVGKMLTALEGEDWKRVRSIVSPTFTSGKLKMMTAIFKDCAQALVQNFRTAAEKEELVDLKKFYGAYTMDIIASSAFSTKINSHNDPNNPFVKTARELFTNVMTWRLLLLGLAPGIMKLLHVDFFAPSKLKFFRDSIHQIIEERNQTGQTRNDFLQLLLDSAKEAERKENSYISGEKREDTATSYVNDDSGSKTSKYIMSKKSLSFDELLSQCLVFFIAGYDTTASTLAFATYTMALQEDIQDKVRAEVDQVLKEHKGELTYEALQCMKYLDNVVSETLRFYPPAGRAARVATDEYTLKNKEITIPKGMVISIPIYAIHKNPLYYPDPDKFDPNRFSPEEKEKRDPFAYIPFGAGPRNCVAMRFALLEVKLCLAYVIRNFRIKKCSKTKVPLEFNVGMGMLQAKDITVSVELREDSLKIK